MLALKTNSIKRDESAKNGVLDRFQDEVAI